MVKIRIHRKKEKRRDKAGIVLPTLLFFILFPYIISGFSNVEKQTFSQKETTGQIWVLQKKLWGMKKIPLEEYLVGMMAATIPAEYEMETLKAQAVIMRSFCVNQMEKENGEKVIYDDVLKDYYIQESQYQELWKENKETFQSRLQTAVKDTKGVVAVCDGDIAELPFCRMSNGNTRDITEYIVRKETYPYMKSVLCDDDKTAEEFIRYVKIPMKEFEEKISEILPGEKKKAEKLVIYRDAKDYVKEIQIEEHKIEGEDFREAFNLISSCFFMEKINDVIEIRTKGIGHGFGFSQYEANRLAKEEKDYRDLLYYFFEGIELEKV